MKSDFWNKRYSESGYVYGTKPNEFFKENILGLTPGKLLLPGEGEGRNAVFAAKNNWKVTAVDCSSQAKIKAMRLATDNSVVIEYIVSSIEDFAYKEDEYDAAALIFVHFPEETRRATHKLITSSLKKGGVLIIEAFNKSQIKNNSGGPKELSMLYRLEDLKSDFMGFSIEKLSEHKTLLTEGSYHSGVADVIRLKGVKI